MHTSHLVNARRMTGRERGRMGCTKSRRNGSRSGVYVHFHFDTSPAFHPGCWHGVANHSPVEYEEAIKQGDGISFGRREG